MRRWHVWLRFNNFGRWVKTLPLSSIFTRLPSWRLRVQAFQVPTRFNGSDRLYKPLYLPKVRRMTKQTWELWLRTSPEWQEIECLLSHRRLLNRESIYRLSPQVWSDQARSEIHRLAAENSLIDRLLNKRFADDLAANKEIITND